MEDTDPSIEIIPAPHAPLVDEALLQECLAQFPRLDRNIVESAILYHMRMTEERGEDYKVDIVENSNTADLASA